MHSGFPVEAALKKCKDEAAFYWSQVREDEG